MCNFDFAHDSELARVNGGPRPTGWCFCGCGSLLPAGDHFASGHASVAVVRAINKEYGSAAEFIKRCDPDAGAPSSNLGAIQRKCQCCNHVASFHTKALERCFVVGCTCAQWVAP